MDNVIERIQNAIKDIDNKTFSVMFFVFDSKGAPVGSLAYIYETAYQLKQGGYNVKMLYADQDFVGVGSWLGEKYASLPHFCVGSKKDYVDISPSDFLFIPELCANAMSVTKNLPCKRVAILQNSNYLTETIPVGVSWDDLKIRDCITTSDSLKERLHNYFPEVLTRVVRPSIPEYFKPNDAPKLLINVIAKNQSEMNSVIKPFYWKYPPYKWVAFRYVANLERKEFAEVLREGFATIWLDTTTDFGYSALEAMASGNIVIGKVPENVPEWMFNEKLGDNGLWFYNNNEAQDIIATAIQSFITDTVPDKVYEAAAETVKMYLPEYQEKDIEKVYTEMFEQRKKELETFLSVYKNKTNEENKNIENNG